MTPDNQPRSAFSQFLAEMGRRHVVRFSFGYAAAAFVLLQLAEIVLPAFGLGDLWLRALVIAVALAFPPAVVLAWVFDLTPEGLKRTEDLPGDGGLGRSHAGIYARVALVVLTFLVAGGLALSLIDSGALATDGFRSAGDGEGSVALTRYDPSEAITSLAVLPLDDFTEGGGQEYFTSGMQEELITQLSQVAGLRVVSRTSVARFAGADTPVPTIGRELGVDAIIEGSVVRVDDRVRITVQLIHASSDTHVWSQRYDRELTDILTLQSEVALEVVRAILGEISPEDDIRLRRVADRSVNAVAQDLVLRGKEAFDSGTPEGLDTAMVLFAEAVKADSSFAPAHAGLASTRFLVTLQDPERSADQMALAHNEAIKALELDSTSVEAREVLKYIESGIETVLPSNTLELPHASAAKGERRYVIALPGMADSVVINVDALDTAWVVAMTRLGSGLEQRIRGLAAKGDGERERALFAARHLVGEGQYQAALTALDVVLESAPELAPGWDLLAEAAAGSGDSETIVGAYSRWAASGAEGAPSEEDVEALDHALQSEGMTGYWTWTLQTLEERRAGGESVSSVDLASAYAGLGDTDKALELLAEGLRQGDRKVLTVPVDPAWDAIRRDPRYQRLSREIRNLRFASPPGS